MPSERPVRVFYSYSHSDEDLLARLRTHLTMLRRRGRITEWFDRNIEAGGEWRAEIAEQLDSADLILLLISSDFLASDFSYDEEMMRAMERSDRDEARVIAVMLRPVDGWEDTPFSKLQVVPRDALPVTRWEDQDEALVDVAAQVRRTVERLQMSEVSASTVARRSDGRRDRETTSYSTRRSEIAAALEELVARPGEHLIISMVDPPNYYVQFLAEERGLWCEAVSNQWIEPQHALGAEEMARLAELGWNAPEENLPNWWWAAPQDAALESVADLALETLTSVYGADLAHEFGVEKSW